MEFTRYTLRNGIRCIHKQVRSAAVHCALTVGTGSRDEQPAEHGMAHLLEHAFFKGTERRRAYHINCRLENLGGELNAYTTKEETVIHTTTLRADLSKAAELIADIVFHSTFPAKELEKEKDIIVDEINSYKDSPSERIFDDFEDLVFKGSSLGHNILGSKASLMKYTRDDLKRFVARTYNTDQMVFSVIGNVSPKRFREICDRYFASQTASARTFSRERTAPYEPFSKTLHRNCHQAHCLLGGRAYSLRDDRRVALSLLSNLLGGPSANSLLNLAVRERNGLSYSIESSFTPLSDTGIATIYFGTDKDRTDECLSIVRHELERICRGELKERQLGIAKKQYIGQITLAMESNESYMLSAARSCLIYDSVDGLDELHAKIRSITAAQTAALKSFLEQEYAKGNYVIAGGDFNQTFPGGLDKYPIKNADLWTPGTLDDSMLPDGWHFAYDTATPTCRLDNQPYDAESDATQHYVIDGFILSPNVELTGVQTQDDGFRFSDHNPVLLNIRLK